MTTDVDAEIKAASTIKEAINRVGDKFNLPTNWLNSDFKKTKSYSSKLSQYSKHYCSYYGVLNVRTISDEYLIAMKLMSGRKYKNDFSDVVGILATHQQEKNPISFEQVKKAFIDLYGDWNKLNDDALEFISGVYENDGIEIMYSDIKERERQVKEILVDFEEKYPTVTNIDNVNDIIKALEKKESLSQKNEEIKKRIKDAY